MSLQIETENNMGAILSEEVLRVSDLKTPGLLFNGECK